MQGRTKVPLPADALGCIEPQQEVELLREQSILVRQIVAEQREGLGEDAAPGDHLGASARQEVDGGEVLEYPHRVRRAQDGHRARQPNPRRHLRDGSQHDRSGGDRKIEPVMLAEGEHRKAGRIREFGGGEDLLQALLRADGFSVGPTRRQLTERIKSNLHRA